MARLKDQIVEYVPKKSDIEYRVRPLIRCKDCKWWRYEEEYRNFECTHKSGLMDCLAESWCCYGEEKTN